jgi:polyprenyl synthetase
MNQSMLAAPQAVAPPLDLYGPVAADLEEVERILSQTLKSRYARVQPVVDHVRWYRGKRLRPVLLLLTARACGRVTPAHHMLGAVVEMIHTATLVHDDVLDGASVRRHVPTVNARWGVYSEGEPFGPTTHAATSCPAAALALGWRWNFSAINGVRSAR